MKNSKSTTKECIATQYKKPAQTFAKEVSLLGNIQGIQAPHIPIAGANYDLCSYKIAFVGMETYGWDDLENFITDMELDPGRAVLKCQDWLAPTLILKSNRNTTFWGFIIRFIETFYHIDHQRILNRQEPHPALSSFVWAETNSIERYHVTAQKNGVSNEIWKKVKELSKPLDSIDLLINATHPKVVIITDKWVNENYILKDNAFRNILPNSRKFAFHQKIDIANERVSYSYYYLRDQDTHVFVIPHPRWLGLHKLVDSYINSIISVIESYKIWPRLPQTEEDWCMPVVNKSSKSFKFKFIAELANLLAANNMTMTCTQLAVLFNINEIKTRYNSKYSEKNGRGILTRVVEKAYQYYNDEKNPHYNPQIAQNIAKVFTNKYNNRAWEK